MEEEKSTDTTSSDKVIYSWQALEFNRPVTKKPVWYLVLGVLWLALLAYTFYTQQWLRVVVVAVLGVVVWLMSRMQPREFAHAITEDGLLVGGNKYSFNKYRSFAVVKSSGGERLLLIPKQQLAQGLALQLGGADVERIRTIMAVILPEEDREEDVVDRMNRWLNL